MIWTTNLLTSQMQRLANFIALEGENKEVIGTLHSIYAAHWRFVDEPTARKSVIRYTKCSVDLKTKRDFIGMDMARKFLEMGFTSSTSANHSSGRKYDKMSGKVRPQEHDWRTNTKARVLVFLRKCEIKLHTILNINVCDVRAVRMNNSRYEI